MLKSFRGKTNMASWNLSETNFPIYSIRRLGERYFVVSGGGGHAKTGVPNAFVSNFRDFIKNIKLKILNILSSAMEHVYNDLLAGNIRNKK